jgi:hypothetical protein
MQEKDKLKLFANMIETNGSQSVRIKKSIYDYVLKMSKQKDITVVDYVNNAVAMRIIEDLASQEKES